jgi:hypothetical protein
VGRILSETWYETIILSDNLIGNSTSRLSPPTDVEPPAVITTLYKTLMMFGQTVELAAGGDYIIPSYLDFLLEWDHLQPGVSIT